MLTFHLEGIHLAAAHQHLHPHIWESAGPAELLEEVEQKHYIGGKEQTCDIGHRHKDGHHSHGSGQKDRNVMPVVDSLFHFVLGF